jgi:translation initiation factor 2 alpha subunit (eIF-2alpha)
MAFKKAEWPEPGDLVLTSVQRIADYGAYVTLDEYGKEGLLHVSEVSSGWVRNIRDFAREGQKVILKVLRVNIEKGQVDLSLRRVSKRERREKALSWKRERKAESLLRSVSEKLNMPAEELYAKTGTLIEEKFGGLYEGFETAARDGTKYCVMRRESNVRYADGLLSTVCIWKSTIRTAIQSMIRGAMCNSSAEVVIGKRTPGVRPDADHSRRTSKASSSRTATARNS